MILEGLISGAVQRTFISVIPCIFVAIAMFVVLTCAGFFMKQKLLCIGSLGLLVISLMSLYMSMPIISIRDVLIEKYNTYEPHLKLTKLEETDRFVNRTFDVSRIILSNKELDHYTVGNKKPKFIVPSNLQSSEHLKDMLSSGTIKYFTIHKVSDFNLSVKEDKLLSDVSMEYCFPFEVNGEPIYTAKEFLYYKDIFMFPDLTEYYTGNKDILKQYI